MDICRRGLSNFESTLFSQKCWAVGGGGGGRGAHFPDVICKGWGKGREGVPPLPPWGGLSSHDG